MIKTKEEVIAHFKELFNLPEFDDKTEGSGFFANGKFYVHKNNFSREYVVDELVAYFSENVIESPYYVEIDPFTMIWTKFQIKTL
jgi:hypothetical protein